MKNSLLSICIPSYGHKKLERCLNRIIPIVNLYNIAIYVNDNCVQEEFDIEKYDYPYLYYKKNSCNIGADRNMIEVYKRCDTKYCFWLGDDDYFTEQTIKIIFGYLERGVDLLLLGFKDSVDSICVNSSSDIVFRSALEFYLKYEPNPFYFGNIVFRVMNSNIDYSKYNGSLHAYNGYILESLSSIKDVLIIVSGQKTMVRESDEKTWKKHFFKVMLVDVMKFYKLLPKPYHKYWFFMIIKRIVYYIKRVVLRK